MSYGSTVGGGISDMLGATPTTKTVNPNWYDPLGPSSVGKNGKPQFSPTGAIPIRNSIFDEFGNLSPLFQQNAATQQGMLQTAAANPGYGQAAGLAQNEIAGDYLNGSPQLDQAMAQMRAGSNASSANQDARIRSQFAQNGMSFGTANQEAQEANQAANNASANQAEAQARLQNYQTERGIQQQAPSMLDQSLSSPINYLAQIPNEYLGPLSQIAQVTSGLASGGQIAQPDTMVQPGPLGQVTGAIGQL